MIAKLERIMTSYRDQYDQNALAVEVIKNDVIWRRLMALEGNVKANHKVVTELGEYVGHAMAEFVRKTSPYEKMDNELKEIHSIVEHCKALQQENEELKEQLMKSREHWRGMEERLSKLETPIAVK